MPLADELYRETILDHYHHPRNQGAIPNSTVRMEGVNPLCGDEITLYATIDNGTISDIKLETHGCSINTASSSMMSESVKGRSLSDVLKMIELFKNMMLNRSIEVLLPEEMEELESLEGVKKYPVRIKCALLPWNTLLQAIESMPEQKQSTKVTQGDGSLK